MLILSRKVGQSFIINDTIELKITEITGDKVKIGIDAPSSVKVLRKELRQTVEQNRQAAAAPRSQELLDFIAQLPPPKPKE